MLTPIRGMPSFRFSTRPVGRTNIPPPECAIPPPRCLAWWRQEIHQCVAVPTQNSSERGQLRVRPKSWLLIGRLQPVLHSDWPSGKSWKLQRDILIWGRSNPLPFGKGGKQIRGKLRGGNDSTYFNHSLKSLSLSSIYLPPPQPPPPSTFFFSFSFFFFYIFYSSLLLKTFLF